MTPEQRAVSGAADEADARTDADTTTGPGVWHGHFITALHEAGYDLTAVDQVPDDLTGMSARDRAVWLTVARVYDASLRAEGIDRNERSRTAFRDLVPEAQQAVIVTMLPVIQMLHAVALNPEARAV